MPVSPARAAAFEILLRIESTDAYASEMLHSSRWSGLSSADHELLTVLVMGVLRWRSVLDGRIAEYSTQPLPKLDIEVLTALRIAAYLGGSWKFFLIFRALPRPLRDFYYDLFARYRYKLFGKHDSCPVPSPEVRSRFIDSV